MPKPIDSLPAFLPVLAGDLNEVHENNAGTIFVHLPSLACNLSRVEAANVCDGDGDGKIAQRKHGLLGMV